MTAEDCVDAALSGMDQGERLTAPSLHDLTVLQDYEALSVRVLGAVFDAQPAARYQIRA